MGRDGSVGPGPVVRGWAILATSSRAPQAGSLHRGRRGTSRGVPRSVGGASVRRGPRGKTDPDDIPETPKKPITRTGDLWVLGKHSYDATWRYKAGVSTIDGAFGKSVNDDTSDWQAAYAGSIAYVWMSSLALPDAAGGLAACGFIPRSLIIWDKGHIVIGRGHYHWRHESCWYAVKKGAKANWAGDRKASTLWEIDNPRKSETGHSAQKPVECMQRAIHNHQGDVYDPFVGSGTTVIAGEQEGRSVYALEIEPAYVDVTVKRWEDFTGQKATRERKRHG